MGAYRKASLGNELCPSYANALREYESETDNLSSLSRDIEKRNFNLLMYNMDMKLLATFKAKDVDLDAPDFDYASFKPRSAIRAIVFDGDEVALIYVKEHGYYMLPGGGLENNEDVFSFKCCK